MRLACISDVHFGDHNCILSSNFTQYYNLFKDIVINKGRLDYLILVGDILDFSISSYADACKAAKRFFDKIKAEIADEIVYIPGNHDKFIWNMVEWHACIANKMVNHKEPKEFRRTCPGYIDLTAAGPILELRDVDRNPNGKYGLPFMNGLFSSTDKVTPISIVYPNLYLKTDKGTIMITHGHMMEPAWTLLSDLLKKDPEFSKTGLVELEEFNNPITTFLCTGVGQAGRMSKLFAKIESDAYSGNTNRLKQIIDTCIIPKLVEEFDIWDYLEKKVYNALRDSILNKVKNAESSRFDKEFMKKESVRKRFRTFFNASVSQMEELGLASPNKIIFAHTHDPFPVSEPFDISDTMGFELELYNTGGWLKHENSKDSESAEIIMIDTNESISELSSENILFS